MNHKQGLFIVFEGIDRSGKTTQVARLTEALQEHYPVEARRFPDRTTPIGRVIDAYLQSNTELDDHVIHLLYSANRWECMKEFSSLLDRGVTLVVDRYWFSGVAFSSAKPGMDYEWCRAPDVGLLVPDLVIYLDMPVKDAAQRGDYGKERYEREEFQHKVRLAYERLKDDSWVVVDAARTPDEVHAEILRIVKGFE